MTVRVATVLSVRDWEPTLVAYARETAAVRIVLRAFQPRDVEANASDIDVVVAGGDVTWVTPHQLGVWRRLGLTVVGVHARGDQPAASMLELGGAAEVVPDDIAVEGLVQAIRFAAPSTRAATIERRGSVVAVIGARGAPGITEMACALAVVAGKGHRTVLVDGDLSAPAIAIRLGLAPRPDVSDVADSVRSEGVIDPGAVHSGPGFDVITGSHRENELPLRTPMFVAVVEAAAQTYDKVVVDCGSDRLDPAFFDVFDEVVLVVDGSPTGIVRAAQLTGQWLGPTPSVIVNRVTPATRAETVAAVRRWTGLEPTAVVPHRDRVRRHAAAARRPDRTVCRAMEAV